HSRPKGCRSVCDQRYRPKAGNRWLLRSAARSRAQCPRSSAHFLPECGRRPVAWRSHVNFQAHFCNAAWMCARLLLDPRLWTSASGFHPEYHQQSTRCRDRGFGCQTALPRCSSREPVTRPWQAVVYNEKGENRSGRSQPADSSRLMTAIEMPPVFFVQQQKKTGGISMAVIRRDESAGCDRPEDRKST